MTTPHRTLQMALDALYSGESPPNARQQAAIAALREAMAAPQPEPVALESVHLTRDTRGMCVVRVNGRVAIRDNGDIIDHMATLEWFAAPPAAPAPTVPNGCEKIFTHKWLDPDCIERGCKSLAAPPAAPAVPLTGEIEAMVKWLRDPNKPQFSPIEHHLRDAADLLSRLAPIAGLTHGVIRKSDGFMYGAIAHSPHAEHVRSCLANPDEWEVRPLHAGASNG